MSDTSGFYRRDRDDKRECEYCEWAGEVTITEDYEDRTLWWTCPGCGHQETEHPDEIDDRE